MNVLMDIMEFEGMEFERIHIDDGGASEEAEVHYHINCPYLSGDERGLCVNGKESCRELCVNCLPSIPVIQERFMQSSPISETRNIKSRWVIRWDSL